MTFPGLGDNHLQTDWTLSQLFLDIVSLVVMFLPLSKGEETPLTGDLLPTLVLVDFLLVRLQLGVRGKDLVTEGAPPVLAHLQQAQARQ